MSDCIFCKIAEKIIPANIVYEDNDFLAFLDIRPISSGHTIVISKKHIADMESMDSADVAKMMNVVKKIGLAMLKGLEVKGYSVFLDNKSAANQHVPHIHFHIVPRIEGDGLDRWPQQDRYEEDEEKRSMNLIIEGLEE
ncbi:HIT domain-containing protein [Candidatus Parcubacteria bacterium]|nr:HIT domain-containing protein [Candidatus Parcubacteria bacterium]